VDPFEQRCDVLAGAWSWWAATLGAIEEDSEAWRRRTRLDGWDVAALVAHHGLLVQGVAFLAQHPIDAPAATRSAAAMLYRFNEPSGVADTAAAAVAEMARQQAASASTSDLVGLFRNAAPAAIDASRAIGPVVVEYFGNGPFPLAEVLSIAVMEAVVHGLDLCAALDIENCSIPSEAIGDVVALLASIADPVELIEAATGRNAAQVFPVVR
jgi:uncharacterized protein (TIGR03083 family)